MQLKIQELLINGMTADELLEIHGVHLKDPIHNKHTLVYDQIKAKESDPIAQECRGLILREGSWDIVAFPFKRFFNHGQTEAAEIHWESAEFQEKLDGSCIIIYWDDYMNQWCAGTRGTSEAQAKGPFGYTFRQLIEKTLMDMGFNSLQHLMAPVTKDHTYIFELTAPENRIICEYTERKLTLIGARDLNTLNEVDPEPIAQELGVDIPDTLKLTDFEALMEVVAKRNPKYHEGVVVKDQFFARIKVKSPKYLVLHHATDSLKMSWRAVMEAVAQGHADDLEGMMPDVIQQRIDTARSLLQDIYSIVEKDYSELKHIKDKKEFALAAKDRRYPSALFALNNGRTATIEEYVKQANPKHLVDICGLKD